MGRNGSRTPKCVVYVTTEFITGINSSFHNTGPSQNGVDSRGRSPMNTSSNSSIYSFRDTSLSRQPSVDDVPEYEPPQLQLPSTPPPSSPTTSTDDRRGRRHSRFSISAVSNVILDAVKERVRSSSPQARIKRDATASRERGIDRSRDSRATSSRGRTLEPRKDNEHNQKGSTFSKFGDLLKLDTDDKESGDGWKEFKKGALLVTQINYVSCSRNNRYIHLPDILCNPGRLSADSRLHIWLCQVATKGERSSSRRFHPENVYHTGNCFDWDTRRGRYGRHGKYHRRAAVGLATPISNFDIRSQFLYRRHHAFAYYYAPYGEDEGSSNFRHPWRYVTLVILPPMKPTTVNLF